VVMEQLELFGLNNKTLCIFQTEMFSQQNIQHYLQIMDN
jgi:hypothetical protein